MFKKRDGAHESCAVGIKYFTRPIGVTLNLFNIFYYIVSNNIHNSKYVTKIDT